MIGRLGVLGVCLLAAGAAHAGDTAADESNAVEGFVETGETVKCVSMLSTDINAIDEGRLLFKVGNRYFLNETKGNCYRSGASSYRLEAALFGPRACRGDIFRVVDNQGGFQVGACNLGEFRALRKSPEPAPADEAF
jgi:hypothetical protein